MPAYSFFDEQTGEFTGRTFDGPAGQLAANTPAGCVARPGIATRPRPTAAIAADIRSRRDALLSQSDAAVLRFLERGEPVPSAWLAYRQALRDIPQQPGFPQSVEWPAVPAPMQ